MEFRRIVITSKTGTTYEISEKGEVRSITKNGVVKTLKTKNDTVTINGDVMNIIDLVKEAFDEPESTEELFESIRKGHQFEIFVGNRGTLKHVFRNGRTILKNAEELHGEQNHLEHPQVVIYGRLVNFHKAIVEAFIGELPPEIEVDHISENKYENHLGNLTLVADVNGIASFVDKKYEKTFSNVKMAIKHAIKHGYPDATTLELEKALNRTKKYDVPIVIYGRTWFPVNLRVYSA